MKRLIVDYGKITPEVMQLLAEKFPQGHREKDIIIFRNASNEVFDVWKYVTWIRSTW